MKNVHQRLICKCVSDLSKTNGFPSFGVRKQGTGSCEEGDVTIGLSMMAQVGRNPPCVWVWMCPYHTWYLQSLLSILIQEQLVGLWIGGNQANTHADLVGHQVELRSHNTKCKPPSVT